MSISRFTGSACALTIAATTQGAIIDSFNVGTGANLATIQIDQEDGDGYLFRVAFDSSSYTSWDALMDIDAAIPSLALTYETYSWGIFLTGVSIDGDTDFGTGDLWPIENWWHFWLHDSGTWNQASFGATDRLLFDGASDAWTFGSPTPPQSVPAPGALALMLFSGAVFRGRRRSAHTRASQPM